MKFEKNITQHKGFTLVETLVGITILLISVITPLSVVSNALTYTQVARDEIVANNLAQEALEYARNQRDLSSMTVTTGRMDNFLTKFGNYATGTETNCYNQTYGCNFDVRQTTFANSVRACSDTVNECGFLYVNNKGATPTYTYTQANLRSSYDATLTNWTATTFKRVVKMKVLYDRTNPQEVEMIVTVTWTNKGAAKTITMREYINGWQNGFIN